MSNVGKALLVVTLIGTLASLGLGFLVLQDKGQKEQELTDKSANLDTTTTKLKAAQKDLDSTKKDLTETSGKLTEATTKSQTLQTSLDEAQSKATKLEGDVKSAEAKVKDAEAKVEEVNKALDGKTPAEIKSAALKAQEELTNLQREKKIIDDQLAAATAEVNRLKDIMERSKDGKMPPGITAKVMSVNPAWNFVVLNVGEKDGVVPNGLFIVYRGKDLIGKVKIVSAEANTSVADILPEWNKGEIKVGDDVFN